jgi:hypothetical protein
MLLILRSGTKIRFVSPSQLRTKVFVTDIGSRFSRAALQLEYSVYFLCRSLRYWVCNRTHSMLIYAGVNCIISTEGTKYHKDATRIGK